MLINVSAREEGIAIRRVDLWRRNPAFAHRNPAANYRCQKPEIAFSRDPIRDLTGRLPILAGQSFAKEQERSVPWQQTLGVKQPCRSQSQSHVPAQQGMQVGTPRDLHTVRIAD